MLFYLYPGTLINISSMCLISRLHDPANVKQTSNKCIQNTRANCSTFAGNLLDVCWTYAGSLRLHGRAFIQLARRSMAIRRAGGL